jgi:molybdenum cofactor guanylyltransferase
MMKPYLFNPFEISICGYSGLGKTTLICKLIESLKKTYSIGYIKHDAHHFEMDKPGKDTYQATQSGASGISIYNSQKDSIAFLGKKTNCDLVDMYHQYDIVLIEGMKGDLSLPKIVFLDEDSSILNEINEDTILLTVSPDERNNVKRIEDTILTYFQSKISKIPFYGLVLTGGYSTRMGKDKAFLTYKETPQYQQCLNLLSPICDSVFLSCRKDQESEFEKAPPKVIDQVLNSGPLGGILSAQMLHPEAAWLVIACDLPFLTPKTLLHLKTNRHAYKMASAFKSSSNGLPEPLCAIYEPKSFKININFFGNRKRCPRKILINSDCHLIDPIDKHALDNINTSDEFNTIKAPNYD